MKICTLCKLEKDLNLFRKSRNQCKSCESARQQLYRKNNKEYYDSYNKLYKIDNKTSLKEQNKTYNLSHKEEKSKYNSKYYQDNKKSILEYKKAYQKNKRKINPYFRLRSNISNSINKALKKSGASKSNNSILKYLPYTIIELKEYLEGKFEPWMNWSNWGA